MSHRGSRRNPGDRDLGVAAMAAHKRVIWCLKGERRVSESPPSADSFAAQDHTRERKEERKNGKEREWVARTYPHHRRPIHHGLPTRTTTGTCGSGGYSNPACSMLTMRTEGVVGLRELGTPAECGNLDVDRVGATDTLTDAVMVMVIIIVERIKHSRRE